MSSLPAEFAVRLPHVLTIGFVGDGPVADPILCRARIDEFLAERRGRTRTVVCGASSLVHDVPPIFAESCIASGSPLRLLLPLPRQRFLHDCTPADRARFEHVLDHALSIEVAGSDASLAEAHYECSLQVVQQSQELLALWDGQLSTGLASTGEIVAFAGQMRCPVTWIDRTTGDVQTIPQPAGPNPSPERELDFLNGISDQETVAAQVPTPSIADQWLARLDAGAVRVAPQVRKLAAAPIVCTAIAAFATAAGPGQPSTEIWIAVGAVIGLAASLMPMWLKLGPRQALWVRIRTAAEITRSMVALWPAPTRYKIVGPGILPELSGMIRSLDLQKSQALQSTKMPLADFQELYVKERLLDQMDYFHGQSTKAAKTARQYRLVSKIASIAAIAMSAWDFVAHFIFKSHPKSAAGLLVGLVAPALFQVATIAGALLIVKDCDRRQRRYLELHRTLADWEAELRAFRSWPPVIEVVTKVERALLVELLEWRSLLQNMKMPRN
jgi:hypothetical protein